MLDLRALAQSVPALARSIHARRTARTAQVERAVLLYRSCDGAAVSRLEALLPELRGAIAFPEEPLGPGIPIAPPPSSYALVATDGSTLDPDPHTNPDFYVINIGEVRIVYGPGSGACITSTPALFMDPGDLWVGRGQERRVKRARDIALERDRLELTRLADAACALPTDRPRIALLDGSLLRWDLEQLDDDARSAFLAATRAAMERFTDEGIALAGYIAASRSRELVSAVETASCAHADPPCRTCAIAGTDPPDIVDADLLRVVLSNGTRSARTRTISPVLTRLGIDVCSVWIHSAGHVVKLELPRFVVDAKQVEILASVIIDQLTKGAGYPPVLQEAHEAAVLTTGDRAALLSWIGQHAGLSHESAKARSKRLKRI